MNKFTSLIGMYSSSEYEGYISDKLGNGLFIDNPERAERVCTAAEEGCDGSLHCEIIDDWRGFLGTLTIQDGYSDPDDYYDIDETTEDHIRAEINACEEWHIANGSYESQLG